MTETPSGGELEPLDSLETRPPDSLADVLLSRVLRNPSLWPGSVDRADAARIGIRAVPRGFLGIRRSLAREFGISQTSLIFIAVEQGLEILDAQPSIIALKHAYEVTSSDALSSGDRDALGRLDQITTFEFQHVHQFRTTLTVSRTAEARLADLGTVCGISMSKVAIIAVAVSLLTLPNNRGYREVLQDEVDAFYRYVAYRHRVLSLGPAAGLPGTAPRRRSRA